MLGRAGGVDGNTKDGLELQGSLIRTVTISDVSIRNGLLCIVFALTRSWDQNDVWIEAFKEATSASGDIVLVRQVWYTVMGWR